ASAPHAARVAVAWLVASETVTFGALLWACAVVRARAPVWRLAGDPALPRGAEGWGALLLLFTVAGFALAAERARAGAAAAAEAGWLAGLAAGLAALALRLRALVLFAR